MQNMDNRICKVCGKLYKSPSSLRRHISSAHSTNLYKCKYCPAKYKRTDNLNIHMAQKHGEGLQLMSRNSWDNLPCHKSCDTTELHELTHMDRASSPITITDGLPCLTGKSREINPPNKAPKTDGKILYGKIINSWRNERKWLKDFEANKPLKCKTVDKDKVKSILSQPKRPIKFPKSQESVEIDPLNLKRIATQPVLFNPTAKKPTLRMAPVKKNTNNNWEHQELVMPSPMEAYKSSNGQSIEGMHSSIPTAPVQDTAAAISSTNTNAGTQEKSESNNPTRLTPELSTVGTSESDKPTRPTPGISLATSPGQSESNKVTRFTPEPSVAGPSKPYTPPSASTSETSSRQLTLDSYIKKLIVKYFFL